MTVAVIGLGAWGSSTLWRLAAAGVKVIGFEQFTPGHANGSSHGGSRMFRTACLEHNDLVPLAQRSLTLWRELEDASGEALFDNSGGLLIGPRDGHVVAGTLAAARVHGIPVEELSADQLGARFPAHQGLPADHVGVWEPTGGLIRPEAAIRAAVATARTAGAVVYENTRVTEIDVLDDGAVVRTPTRDFRVEQVVVTAGPWVAKLLPELPLEPVRMPTTWFRPTGDVEPFALKNFPSFIRELGHGKAIWGHGFQDGPDVKLGLEDGGGNFKPIDPDTTDRGVTPADWHTLTGLLATAVPGLGALPSAVTTCMITKTPDRQFLLGRPRGSRALVVGAGCAGHGFKHATGIGEALADITLGRPTGSPLGFTDPNRFL
ncbi:N-methyl-L-tryptophan oxidase [Kutzneria chonburiensis]|uniref:N-methyl-L-tryptophan oxidase n=1 Tax=Kutzneria chonburiensis TaxID=1483604 RepID=A0ABV6N6M0_9PSEU|nr:N-methyl-L-tryptophan oxidase [Kutzneria chonburiensis]